MGHAACDLDTRLGHIGKLVGVVGPGEDRVAQVLAHFGLIDVERRDEFNVAHMVAAEIDVHQARDEVVFLGVVVVLDALYQR